MVYSTLKGNFEKSYNIYTIMFYNHCSIFWLFGKNDIINCSLLIFFTLYHLRHLWFGRDEVADLKVVVTNFWSISCIWDQNWGNAHDRLGLSLCGMHNAVTCVTFTQLEFLFYTSKKKIIEKSHEVTEGGVTKFFSKFWGGHGIFNKIKGGLRIFFGFFRIPPGPGYP